jgi:hypothetical protein
VSLLWAKRGWLTPGSQTLRALDRFGASDVWDFVDNSYMRAGVVTTNAGLTVTRASSGYAETSDGRLVSFGSGVLRRTDRGVLIEGARTNGLTHSLTLQTGWAAFLGATISSTDTFTTTSTFGSGVEPNQPLIAAAGTTVTSSAWLSGSGACEITVKDASGSFGRTTTSVTLTATPTRYSITRTLVDANAVMEIRSVGTASTITVFKPQLEAGAFASSPIDTLGGTATRAADLIVANQTGPTYPITLYAEIDGATPNGEPLPRFLQWEAGTGARIELVNADPTLTTDRTYAYAGIGGGINAAVVSGLSGRKKVAAKIESGALRLSANGGAVATGTATGTAPTGDLYFGNRTDGARSVFDYLRRVAIFPSAFTDAQLQAITS